MHPRLSFPLAALLLVAAAPVAVPQSISSAASDHPLTLQVASFPTTEQAVRFIDRLVKAGEHPGVTVVQLQDRGYWTRVFIGAFNTSDDARRYGERLVAKGLIKEFLVKRVGANEEATRPRRVMPVAGAVQAPAGSGITAAQPANPSATRDGVRRDSASFPDKRLNGAHPRLEGGREAHHKSPGAPLPVVKVRWLEVAPTVGGNDIPRPDPVSIALRLAVGEDGHTPHRWQGGLWVTGDTTQALERLRWIVGDENADLIRVENGGRVELDKKLLARVSGLAESRADDPVTVANYVFSNEGLFLMVQLTQGRNRYRLHVDRFAPTRGKSVEVSSSINLDRNYDSRINPYRRQGRKLDNELPPDGFDALIALNPAARWYNLRTRDWVNPGEVTFHELAEAYAKVDLGLDYLAQGVHPGAHSLALDREQMLQAQRPREGIVMTTGSNRVLRTEQEVRLFFADYPGRE